VRGHGGSIQVDSEQGEGTTITILLPADPTAVLAELTEAPAAIDQSHFSGTVLLVEDEEEVRQVARRMLRRCGLDVITADDGMAGVTAFSEFSDEITLVLLDTTMPRLGGEQALRAMRRIRPDVRIILTSGYSEEDPPARRLSPETLFLLHPDPEPAGSAAAQRREPRLEYRSPGLFCTFCRAAAWRHTPRCTAVKTI
jgi:CheY-like chemotaxis protein